MSAALVGRKLLGGDELTPADLSVNQLTALIKDQGHFNPFKAELVADQGFMNHVTTLIGVAQITLQVKASFYDLTATTTADIDIITLITGFAAGKH